MDIQNVSNWCIHSLKHYFSATKWDRNTVWVVFYSLNFLKPVHVQNVHLVPQYTPNNDLKQSNIPYGLLLMEYHWWHVQNSMNTGDHAKTCMTASALSLSVELLFLLHRPFNTSCTVHDFKLVSDSCYCYPCWWWCTKSNPPTSLNFNILHFSITLQ